MAPTEHINGAEKVPPHEVPAIAHPTAEGSLDVASNIMYHAQYSPHFSPLKFEVEQAFFATADSARDTLIRRWNETYMHFHKIDPKQTFYLSMEYLQGRALTNAIGNLGLFDAYGEALNKLGYELENVAEQEKDASLGNGGLGRLASCFLDSMATLDLPAWGYGLRYKYGLFKQKISSKGQEEFAEDWLEKFSPWEITRYDVIYKIHFFGTVQQKEDGRRKWVSGECLHAQACDIPIPGYKTKNTISLRLWKAKALASDFDLHAFNSGKHDEAAHLHHKASQICAVLYPADDTSDGKLLRLKQQYFLCSASLQDIIARFKERRPVNIDWKEFPKKVAVQMNDTHPTLCIPELMRILVDEEGVGWDEAWAITSSTVAYTNHTVLPEALEKWPLQLLTSLLPRHVEIITEIDKWFKELIRSSFPNLESKLGSLSIIDDSDPGWPLVRMAHLCILSSHAASFKYIKGGNAPLETMTQWTTEKMLKYLSKVNGVAELHSNILKEEVFADFYSIWGSKFQNKTNGITPRRWLRFCNRDLSAIITKWLKTDEWITNLDLLAGLRRFADNNELQSEWAAAKMANKIRFAKYIEEATGVKLNLHSLFDTQIKRIHEYKRQFMNILGVIYRYKKLKEMSPEERKKVVPRSVMIGGKAFSTYAQAKRIVKLVLDVGAVINHDPDVSEYLKVVFIPNYNVTVAELAIPGSELSQHISTAGMEASGTSNMKFALNGCLIIGTLDGANVEIREEIGDENFFLFGARADEISRLRKEKEQGKLVPDPCFEEVKKIIRSGTFGSFDYNILLESLEGGWCGGDYYLVGYDFPAYLEAQDKVDEAYKDQKHWTRMSILSTAGSGKFSSDRTISQYAKDIWGIQACPVP